MQPLSNLVATGQMQAGDRLLVERDGDRLVFAKEANELASAAA